MKIWVDCDAMPRPLKEVLCQVAGRKKLETWFVAAVAPRLAESEFIRCAAAGHAFNGADDWIVDRVESGDIVISADIPLSDRVITKGAKVLNTKGEILSQVNIKNVLAMRELMEELRITGEVTGGPAPFSDRQRVNFINALNRLLQ